MEVVKGGLGIYAKFQTYIMIFIGIVMCLIGSYIGYRVNKGNYQKAKSGEVGYFRIDNLAKCTPAEIANRQCELKVSYKDALSSNEYKQPVDTKRKQGPVSVYYKKDEPTSYMITPTPYLITGIIICISLVMLVVGFIRYKIMNSSENAGAALGAFDVASNVFSGPSTPQTNYIIDSSSFDSLSL